MTVEELQAIGIPLPQYSQEDTLYVESALDWLSKNTTLEFDKKNLDQLKSLPAGAKLFIAKYREVMKLPVGVTSESVDGLSQSFSDTLKSNELAEIAEALLGEFMKPAISIVTAKQKWGYCPWR